MLSISTCYTDEAIEVRALNVTMPLGPIYQIFGSLGIIIVAAQC